MACCWLVQAVNDDPDKNYLFATPGSSIPYDGEWHHVAITADLSNGTSSYALDAVNHSWASLTASGVFAVPWENTTDWSVGGASPAGADPALTYKGDLAELMVLTRAYVDITDVKILGRLIDFETWRPISIDAGGLYFMRNQGVIPDIFLSGNENFFPRNYPPWSATAVRQFDTVPTSQFAVVGHSLTTASTDPFG